MDAITLKRIDLLHPLLRADVKEIYAEICERLSNKKVVCRFSSTYRTKSEQDALFAQGRTTKGKIVTMARGGESLHNMGLAIDVCAILNGVEASWDFGKDWDADGIADLMEVIQVFKMYGWEWANDWTSFKEKPHVQKSFGYNIKQLQKLPTFIQDNIQYPKL